MGTGEIVVGEVLPLEIADRGDGGMVVVLEAGDGNTAELAAWQKRTGEGTWRRCCQPMMML